MDTEEKNKSKEKKEVKIEIQLLIKLLIKLAVIALVGWILFGKIFLVTQVSGNDMFPAIKDGDLLLAYRIQKDYKQDDSVVYCQDGELRVGRILAFENDVATIDDSGELLVNGTLQSEEILYPTYAKDGITYPYTVPEGEVFILCDFRTEGTDSRDFGSVSLKEVKGLVITLMRRREI